MITAGLVLKFLHKMSLYSGIYDRRRKIRVKCSHETADKFLNTSTDRHLLYAYGYMLNQGKSFFWRTHTYVLLLEPLVPLFLISGDVSSGFQARVGSALFAFLWRRM